MSCQNAGETKSAATDIIFDTDMGNDVDDALALDMLYKYMDEGRIDLKAVVLNKEGLAGPEFIDIMGTWYGYPDIPVGIIRDGAECGADSTVFTRKIADMKTEDGRLLFARTHSDYGDWPESVDLYRKTLSEASDTSVVIVSVGFSTNLARLLESGADEYSDLCGKELVSKKVKAVYAMAGSVTDTTHHEYNVVTDIMQVCYPASSIENDFGWAGPHPAVEAYKLFEPMPHDRPCWDLTAVLAAVENGPEYFSVSPSGSISVTDAGATIFEEGEGNRAYLFISPEQAEAVKSRLISLVTRPAGQK